MKPPLLFIALDLRFARRLAFSLAFILLVKRWKFLSVILVLQLCNAFHNYTQKPLVISVDLNITKCTEWLQPKLLLTLLCLFREWLSWFLRLVSVLTRWSCGAISVVGSWDVSIRWVLQHTGRQRLLQHHHLPERRRYSIIHLDCDYRGTQLKVPFFEKSVPDSYYFIFNMHS